MHGLKRALGAVALVALACSACSSPSGGGNGGNGGGGGGSDSANAISVVASTDVYGDIVTSIAGDAVSVTSIISEPNQDPHSYEGNAKTQQEISKASLIIENGGGYDDFVDSMRTAANSNAAVLNAVDISGKKAAGGDDLNEHVWYDFPTVLSLIDQIVSQLTILLPTDAATFTANAGALSDQIKGLVAQEAAIKAIDSGQGTAITEPVPLYMLTACGLINKTPKGFSESIEDGTDVSVRDLQDTLTLFSTKAVKLLAYNEQTSSAETEKVLSAAKSAGIAVVPVTETLPAGTHYVGWMTSNLAAIKAALS
jgi:zinc/manganese transport system substrate-binding protein